MSISVGEYVMQRLTQWGVDRLYAYPGDGINGLIAGLPSTATHHASFKPGTKNWPRSWLPRMPSSRGP